MAEPNEMSVEFLDQFSIQIARVVIAAGHFDDELTATLTSLLDLKPIQEAALVRPMQPRAKLDLLERLSKQFLSDAKHKQFAKYTKAAKATLDERNALIHGSAGHLGGKVSFRSFTGKYKLTGTPQRWSIERVSDLATALQDHEKALTKSVSGLASKKADLQSYQPQKQGHITRRPPKNG